MGRSGSEILVKQEAEANTEAGENPNARPVEELINCGVVNIDKPAGITSRDTADRVEEILGISKAGHSGTLDPAVTGVLPVGLGRATRVLESLLSAGKEYVCRMRVHGGVERGRLEDVFREFTGLIRQIPPVRSAVKRQERERRIYYMDILSVRNKEVVFKVDCQAGTYIRKLVHDMGEKLGTGAHMVELRRTRVGCFDESTLCTLQKLADAIEQWRQTGAEEAIRKAIQPIENAVAHLAAVWIDDGAVEPVCHGSALAAPGIIKLTDGMKAADAVALKTLNEELVAIGTAEMSSAEMMQAERGIAVRTRKVFMRPGLYKKS